MCFHHYGTFGELQKKQKMFFPMCSLQGRFQDIAVKNCFARRIVAIAALQRAVPVLRRWWVTVKRCKTFPLGDHEKFPVGLTCDSGGHHSTGVEKERCISMPIG